MPCLLLIYFNAALSNPIQLFHVATSASNNHTDSHAWRNLHTMSASVPKIYYHDSSHKVAIYTAHKRTAISAHDGKDILRGCVFRIFQDIYNLNSYHGLVHLPAFPGLFLCCSYRNVAKYSGAVRIRCINKVHKVHI